MKVLEILNYAGIIDGPIDSSKMTDADVAALAEFNTLLGNEVNTHVFANPIAASSIYDIIIGSTPRHAARTVVNTIFMTDASLDIIWCIGQAAGATTVDDMNTIMYLYNALCGLPDMNKDVLDKLIVVWHSTKNSIPIKNSGKQQHQQQQQQQQQQKSSIDEDAIFISVLNDIDNRSDAIKNALKTSILSGFETDIQSKYNTVSCDFNALYAKRVSQKGKTALTAQISGLLNSIELEFNKLVMKKLMSGIPGITTLELDAMREDAFNIAIGLSNYSAEVVRIVKSIKTII